MSAVHYHRFNIEQEIAAYTRSQLIREKPELEKEIRGILCITHDIKDTRPIHQKGIVYTVFTFLDKKDLASASAVSRIWRDTANSPKLWSRILVADDDVPLNWRARGIKDRECDDLAKTYYECQSAKVSSAIASVGCYQAHEQFKRAQTILKAVLFLSFFSPVTSTPTI